MNITIDHIITVFGLVMTTSDLYYPKLSINLERLLQKTQRNLIPASRTISESKEVLKEWLIGSFIWRLSNYVWWWFLYLFFYLVIVGTIEETPKEPFLTFIIILGLPPFIYMVFVLVPIGIFVYLYPVYSFISHQLAILVWLIERLFHFLNYIGKGKALAGIGLLLTFRGLILQFLN